MTRHVATITRNRGRWTYGDLQPYDLSNRFGNGSRPGREDYAIFLSDDPEATEPVLDHSNAHLQHFDPIARISRASQTAPSRVVYRGRPSSARPVYQTVR